ncbi:MAG: hypothetical protein KQA34_01645 [Candidatus Aenigmarchaeota archaeon]|nr:hypothetical protein [Candidatus Aenigmarchaeota archaeon]
MELIRIIILSAAFLIVVGVGGLIYNANFVQVEAATSNFVLVLVALLLLIFAAYLLLRHNIKLQFKRLFLEKSDEATLLYVKNELKKLKNTLDEIKKVDKRNANKVLKNVKLSLKNLVPYKPYLSNIFVEGIFLENMNKILSFNKITSSNLSEFSTAIKELKEELKELDL